MNWYLKKGNGEVYGPVDNSTLRLWATDGRVAPEDMLSADQKKWMPASDLVELCMEWTVELRDGPMYGPIHLMALRDLIHDGSISRRAKIKHVHTGEEAVAGEALLIELIKPGPPSQSGDEALAAKPKPVVTPPVVPLPGAPSAKVQDLQAQVEKLKKQCEDERAAATAREADLRRQVHGQKNEDDQHNTLVQEVEKWKKMHAHAVAQIEQMKGSQRADQPAGGDLVPRARLEDAEKKLAQTERSYQQLLKTLNRNIGAQMSGRLQQSPDMLQRRDVG